MVHTICPFWTIIITINIIIITIIIFVIIWFGSPVPGLGSLVHRAAPGS